MRSLLSALFIFAFVSIGFGQPGPVDRHPGARIYLIDSQSGQSVEGTGYWALMFKSAVIELVRNTDQSNAILGGAPPSEDNRVFTVSQMGGDANFNGYQISLDKLTNDPNQPINVYTFAFHQDDNTLYFYDKPSQQWLLVRITPNNMYNLRQAADYNRRFNQEMASQSGQGGVNVSVDLNAPVDADVVATTPPPAMPDYEQPECPSDGYLWQPGYWAYSPDRTDYYWVPGAWVAPPSSGVLWTPPYWGYEGSRFVFHVGYWGDHVGFYGGINYGYGYGGHGYYGGEWRRGRFNYNTAVVRVNTTVVHNTYINKTVINNVVINNNHTSFNGRGGVEEKPTQQEISATNEHHIKPTPEQNGNQLSARNNPQQFVKNNPGGKPPLLATPKAVTYHPQNTGAKGPNGIGANNVKRPTTPVKPTGPPTSVKPQGQPANPAKPQGLLTNPAKPQGQPANPVKPQGQPTDPAKPQGLLTNPAKPQGQPANPVKPQGQPTNPAKPQGLLTNPVKPQGQANNPVKPQVQPTNPAKPQPGLSNTPAKPAKGKPKPKKDTSKAKPVTQPAKQ